MRKFIALPVISLFVFSASVAFAQQDDDKVLENQFRTGFSLVENLGKYNLEQALEDNQLPVWNNLLFTIDLAWEIHYKDYLMAVDMSVGRQSKSKSDFQSQLTTLAGGIIFGWFYEKNDNYAGSIRLGGRSTELGFSFSESQQVIVDPASLSSFPDNSFEMSNTRFDLMIAHGSQILKDIYLEIGMTATVAEGTWESDNVLIAGFDAESGYMSYVSVHYFF